ncbi:hypothetical protein, partial [Lactobacillus equicursoris]|uniref:hypothetical protein n=1 Tax=Lactobacillus equicursoris TaxID=420645 RepID=UPI001EE3225E
MRLTCVNRHLFIIQEVEWISRGFVNFFAFFGKKLLVDLEQGSRSTIFDSNGKKAAHNLTQPAKCLL